MKPMNKSYSQRWLEMLCRQLPNVQSAIFMTSGNREGKMKTLAKWPASLNSLTAYSAIVKYAVKKKEQVHFATPAEADQQAFELFALPLFSQQRLIGIIAIKTGVQTESRRSRIFKALKQGLKWLNLGASGETRDDRFYASVVGLMAACFEQGQYRQALISMVTELTTSFDCERVAFGEYRGHYSQVVALSNSASFDDRSNLMQKLAEAMDEAIEQDQAIRFPDAKSKLIMRHHQDLSRSYGIGSICTLPLSHDGEIFGAVTLLRDEQHPFDRDTLNLCRQAFSLITPYLALKREQEQGLLIKAATAFRQRLRAWFGLRHLAMKLVVVLLAAIMVGAGLMQGDFRVTAKAVLEGRIQRIVAAPFAGYLLAASARAGDPVSAGQVLASMNDQDIRLQLARLEGELQQSRQQYREAQSKRDLVKVRITDEKINQIRAEIELAGKQLERINLTAPFDGVVIEGDLSQSLGAPVERGEALFKVAPLDGYRIILKVDESAISHVTPGQTGALILPSLTGRHLPLKVESITVAAQAEDGANIFRVEASLEEGADLLRPGMQGIGKIQVGRESLLWIWTHEMIDWFRLWLWSWWP